MTDLEKKKRVIDRELLETVRKLPCMCCGKQAPAFAIEAHHITTRGAGGDDVADNLMPLCGEHHREWHAPYKGPSYLIRKYPCVRIWLEFAERWDILGRSKPTEKRRSNA